VHPSGGIGTQFRGYRNGYQWACLKTIIHHTANRRWIYSSNGVSEAARGASSCLTGHVMQQAHGILFFVLRYLAANPSVTSGQPGLRVSCIGGSHFVSLLYPPVHIDMCIIGAFVRQGWRMERKRLEREQFLNKVRTLREWGLTVRAIATELGIHPSRAQRALKALQRRSAV